MAASKVHKQQSLSFSLILEAFQQSSSWQGIENKILCNLTFSSYIEINV